MSNDNGASIDAIHALLVSTSEKVGDMHGRLHHVEADVQAVRVASIAQGQVLAQLQQTCSQRGVHCELRFKRISQDVGMVREDTGVIELEQVRRRTIWWTIAKIVGALVALAGLATGAIGTLRSCAGVDVLRREVARQRQVQLIVEDHARDEALTWIMQGQRELLRRVPRLDWLVLSDDGAPKPRWR